MTEPVFKADFAVQFRDLMLDVMNREAVLTQRVLASVSDDQRDYRPDAKSRSAWELAWHIAADVWFLEGIAELSFDPNPDELHENPAGTSAELAEWYGDRVSTALDRIGGMSGDELLTPVSMGGVAAESGLSFPAFVYLLWAHNHIVHHRGQLSAYLRPAGGTVPSIYGPSADEPGEG